MSTNKFIARKGLTSLEDSEILGSLTVTKTGGTVFNILGSQGQLFSVTDSLTGDLFSVNDISGIPIFTVNSSDKVTMGSFGTNAFIVDGDKVLIGTNINAGYKLDVDGTLRTTGQFTSTLADGTAPFNVTSSTVVTNLNADLLDGQHASAFQTAIPNGTVSQYYRGDKTWVDFDGEVRGAVLTGFAVGADSSVVAGDTLISALGKLQGQINANNTDIAGKENTVTTGTTTQYYRGDKSWQTLNTTAVAEGTNLYFTEGRVLGADLAGFTVGADSTITATDTILSAFGKVQGQINGNNTTLSGKENTVAAGTTAQYYRGDKTWQTLNTTAVSEGTNLYYTQSRFDSAFSAKSTTNLSEGTNLYFTEARVLGTSIAGFTVGSNTALSATDTILGALSKIQGQLNTKTSATGTVTSVAMSVPTGLSITGSPVTTSGTLAISLTTGYSIPTTAKQTNWDTAYGWGNHAGLYSLTSHNHDTRYIGRASTYGGLAGSSEGIDVNTVVNTSVTFTNDTATNLPYDGTIFNYGSLQTLMFNNTNYFTQQFISINNADAFWYRSKINGVYHTWNQVASRKWVENWYLPLAGGEITGGLIISGSIPSNATDMGGYRGVGTNLILKGDDLGRSAIFFQSEKNGVNINHGSDYGFIQFHPMGVTGTTGESNRLIIGVANDGNDRLVLQAPNKDGVVVSYQDATSGLATPEYPVYHTGNLINLNQLTTRNASDLAEDATHRFVTDTEKATWNAKTNNTGTVTSVGLSVPTGLSIAGSPITTSGTLAISLTSGYSIPTTAKQTNWDTAYTYSQVGHIPLSQKGIASGVVPLNTSVKIDETYLPDSILGQVSYKGTYNVSTNTPTLPAASSAKGDYYVVSVAGTYDTVDYSIGDWIISNGTTWEKVDNSDAVTTVFGRMGNVVATAGDYNTSQVTESGNLYFTTARARQSISTSGSLSYNNSTGVISYTTPAETDPIFTAHAATGVTTSKITNWDTAYSRVNATNIGKASSGIDSATNTAALWSALPIGYSAMMGSGIGIAGGAPYNSNYGYFLKVAQRDTSGGWAGLWIGHQSGKSYLGKTLTSTDLPTWEEIWTSTSLTNLNQLTTRNASDLTEDSTHRFVTDTEKATWNAKTSNTGTVTSVGMTVPTGLSVAGSPITTSGTLALSLAAGYSIPTTAKQTNWDTAYGWGNHASAGYLPASSYTAQDVLSKIKTVDGVGSGLDSDLFAGQPVDNFSRLVCKTSGGSSSSANYWTKIATITQGAGVSDDFTLELGFMGEETSTPSLAHVFFRARNGATAPSMLVEILQMTSGSGFDDSSFRIVSSSGTNGTYEIWMRKVGAWLAFNVYEHKKRLAGLMTITYHNTQGWVPDEPTATYSATSNGLEYRGYKVWHSGNDGSGSGLDADTVRGYGLTASNTINTLVFRNGSGDFSAGTITANLTGAASLNLLKGGDTMTGRLTLTDFAASTSTGGAIVIQGPNLKGTDPDSFRGVEIRHASAGGVLIGGLRNSSWGSDFMVRTTTSAGNTFVDMLRVGEYGITYKGNKVWHEANDGTASGLDADLLDGQEGSYYTNATNLSTGTIPNARISGAYDGFTSIQFGTTGNTITSTKISTWDSAYGWGNHASAGYALDSNVLHTTGEETKNGSITFPISTTTLKNNITISGDRDYVTIGGLEEPSRGTKYGQITVNGISENTTIKGNSISMSGGTSGDLTFAIMTGSLTLRPTGSMVGDKTLFIPSESGTLSLISDVAEGLKGIYSDHSIYVKMNSNPAQYGYFKTGEAGFGWVLCNGGIAQIADYPTLFAALGTTYGGDGQTTFGLPYYGPSATSSDLSALIRHLIGKGTTYAGSHLWVNPNYPVTFNLIETNKPAPSDWLRCDGSILSIADYPYLYNVIGTTYGGNGQTTFALPTDDVLDFDIPTNLNQLTTRDFADLQNKPTTVSGYGITDIIQPKSFSVFGPGSKMFSVVYANGPGGILDNPQSLIFNHGQASGLDADLLDGQHASYYIDINTNQTIDGIKTFTEGVYINRLDSTRSLRFTESIVNHGKSYFSIDFSEDSTTWNELLRFNVGGDTPYVDADQIVVDSLQATTTWTDSLILGSVNSLNKVNLLRTNSSDIDIYFPATTGTLALTTDIPTSLSGLTTDSTHRLVTDTEKATWSAKTNNTGTVTSVGMTVPTGLSITGSPITTSGTLALSLTAGYSIPTTSKQGEWDTAYGWGNHASQSYIKLASAITGYVAGSNSALAATDTILSAFGKIQGQLNAKTSNTGTVTSVAMTVPTGLSVTGSPITSSGTLAIGLQSGYSIPTTTKQGEWDTAYTNNHTHSNKVVLDGITSGLVTNWDSAYSYSQVGHLPLAGGTVTGMVTISGNQRNLTLKSPLDSGGNYIEFSNSGGTRTSYIGHGSNTSNDVYYYLPTSNIHRFVTSGVERLTIGSTVTLNTGLSGTSAIFTDTTKFANSSGIIGTSSGITNYSYLSFYESNGTTRAGYIGFGNNSNNTLSIVNDTGGNINLMSNVAITGTLSGTELGLSGNIDLGSAATTANSFGARGVTIFGSGGSYSTGAALNLYQVWNGVSYRAGLIVGADPILGGAATHLTVRTSFWNGSAVQAVDAIKISGDGKATFTNILEVKTNSGNVPNIILNTTTATDAPFTQYKVNGSAGWEIGMATSTSSYSFLWSYGTFGTSNAVMALTNTGRLGIGTATPVTDLTLGDSGERYFSVKDVRTTTTGAYFGGGVKFYDYQGELGSIKSVHNYYLGSIPRGIVYTTRKHVFTNTMPTPISSDGYVTGGGLVQVLGSVNITGQYMINGVPIDSGSASSGISGSGAINKIVKFTGSSAVGNSIITDDGSTVSVAGAMTLGTGIITTMTNQTDGSLRVQNTYGYLDIAPKNAGYAHIYTDRPEIYFNKELKVNGETVWHSGNLTPSNYINGAADDTFSSRIVSTTRRAGIYGTYDSTKIDHVWSMGNAYMVETNGANFGNLYGIAYKHTNNTTGGNMAGGHQAVFCNNGTPGVSIGFGGNIWTTGDILSASSSDQRLKDNIRPIESPLEKLRKLNGYYFEWNDRQDTYEVGKTDVGVVAQEVEEVYPEIVQTRDSGFKAVKYEKLTPAIIAGVNEYIDEQEKKNMELEKKNQELEERIKRLEDIILRMGGSN